MNVCGLSSSSFSPPAGWPARSGRGSGARSIFTPSFSASAIDGAEADVVPRAGIVQAGIAQTHDEPAAGGRFGKQHQNRLEIDVSL